MEKPKSDGINEALQLQAEKLLKEIGEMSLAHFTADDFFCFSGARAHLAKGEAFLEDQVSILKELKAGIINSTRSTEEATQRAAISAYRRSR